MLIREFIYTDGEKYFHFLGCDWI